MSEKNKMLLFIFFIGVVFASSIVTYRYKDEIKNLKIVTTIADSFSHPEKYVKCYVVTSIDGKCLRLVLLIPCKDQIQKQALLQKMPRVRHEILMSVNSAEMAMSIKQKDFKAIKKNLLQIVDKHADKQIKEIFLENFFYN